MYSILRLSKLVPEFKSSMNLALPLILAEIIYALNGFIVTVMIAHLGPKELAANALVCSIYIAVIVFFFGIFCAISTMVAQSFGARDYEGISICFKQGLIMAIVFSLPMMAVMRFVPVILVWTNQDPAVIDAARPFFYTLIWSMLPLNIWIVIEHFFIGITKTKLVTFMSIVLVPTQIFFCYIFLFGKFGFPRLGLSGVGYGITVTNFLMALIFICYLYFSKKLAIYSLFKNWWKIEYKFLFEIIRVGLPIGFMWCSELIFFAIIALMMGKFGVTILAAYQISYQYLMVALVVLFALSQASAVRVGNEVGRNDRSKLKSIFLVNVLIGFGFALAFSVFYIIFPETAISLDVDINSKQFKDVAIEATKFFPIVAVLLLTDSLRLIGSGVLRGLKDTKMQMVISVIGFWMVAFPACYLLAFRLGLGGVGLWWGTVIGLFVTGLIILGRFNKLVDKVNLLSLVTKKS